MWDETKQDLKTARLNYLKFIQTCRVDDVTYRLTPKSDASAYALCFAIFGYYLLKQHDLISLRRDLWAKQIEKNLLEYRSKLADDCLLSEHKPYLQLLTFSLSALAILNKLELKFIGGLAAEAVPTNMAVFLKQIKALEGRARSGNLAMFAGVLLLFLQNYRGHENEEVLKEWSQQHIESMNRYGFWGDDDSMSHLQFQNGYHQYELLDYMQIKGDFYENCAMAVANLSDADGHFAPYPGGGGCYDYDAVFLLTTTQGIAKKHQSLLQKTFATILSEQRPDGGFCESLYVRPITLKSLKKFISHMWVAKGRAKQERFRQLLTLQRPKHNRIHTHWSVYSRAWNEANLWDSWFRMLALARIEVAFDEAKFNEWGFIDFPGLGYHHLLANKA